MAALGPPALQGRFLAAQAIAREAGALACRLRADPAGLDVQLKGPQDFVTAADRAVEALIARQLAAAFPEDRFLGEETQDGRPIELDGALWVVDPIDGTTNFAQGRSDWCVSIGLLDEGGPALGVICHPAADALFAAWRGHGATCNGRTIRASSRDTLAEAVVGIDYSLTTPLADHLRQIEGVLRLGGEYRRNGSAAVSLAHVADGTLDGFVELQLNAWDVAAGIVLVREAGGWTSDFFCGQGFAKGNPIIAAAPGLRDELLRAVGLQAWG